MAGADEKELSGGLRVGALPRGLAILTPFLAERASGSLVYDTEGRELIDFTGGIGVLNVGHSHPRVVEAIRDQAGKLTHSCFMVVPYASAVELAGRLCRLAPGDFPKKAFLANSGAEAVENAVKIARHFTGRPAVIAFENGFHGRTLLAMTLTSKVHPYKAGFGPFAPEVYRLPYPYCYRCPLGLAYPGCSVACADLLESFFVNQVAAESVAALVIEPVTGEGGFIAPPPEYLSRIAAACRKHGIVFVADEIQCGMGRTGRMFAQEHFGIAADLTLVAKSLAAGMPLSAVVGREEIMDAPPPGGLGGTYGGNPVCCRAALAVLDVFEQERLLDRAAELGRKVRERFDLFQERFEMVGDVRGLGPMLGLELVRNRETREPAAAETAAFVRFCHERGLLILSCGNLGNVVRTLMPLNIEDRHLQRGLDVMEEGLASISG